MDSVLLGCDGDGLVLADVSKESSAVLIEI